MDKFKKWIQTFRTDSNETNSDHVTDSGKGESEHESFSSQQVQVTTMPSQTHHTIQGMRIVLWQSQRFAQSH